MTIPYPPPSILPEAPADYPLVLLSRFGLVALGLAGLSWIIHCRRKQLQLKSFDLGLWGVVALLGAILTLVGCCREVYYDNNVWLIGPVAGLFTVVAMGVIQTTFAVWDTTFQRLLILGYWSFAHLVLAFLLFVFMIQLYPVLTVRPAAYAVACKQNLKQIALAVSSYEEKWQRFPPNAMGNPRTSWRVTLLPFIDQSELHRKYQVRQEWNQPPNAELARESVNMYSCPGNPLFRDSAGRRRTAYSIPTGPGSIGAARLGSKKNQITDGLSQTLLLVEACGAEIIWTEPRDINTDSQPAGVNLSGKQHGQSAGWLSSYHEVGAAGAHAAFADGSVRLIASKTDQTVLRKLARINDGQSVEAF